VSATSPSPPPSPTPPESAHESKDRALFDRISDAYARKDLAPASRAARRHRLLRTLASVPLSPAADVLEAGCGAGFSAVYLRGRYGTFHGIDYAQGLIDYARQHNAGPGVTFEIANIKDFDPGRRFDVIVMIGVLHHLDDMDAAMRHLATLLKPGGWIAANEPQPANPLIRAARRARTRVDAAYSDEQDQLSGARLRAVYEGAGLANVRVRPQGLLSTPFAEVVLKPQWLTQPLAKVACAADTVAETLLGPALRPLTWNLVATGQKAP
jgi:trans-aconitate methyltransferase